LAVREVNEPLFREDRQDRLQINFITETLVSSERELECRAFHVIEKNVQVVRVNQRMLW
jgi:hypothetical protein